MNLLHKILANPRTRNLSVDDPRTTLLRREIIQNKAFLHALYLEWYERIMNILAEKRTVLELGSGAGFFQQVMPTLITSEVFETPGVNLIADARHLPLSDQSLDAIVMTDVFHHIPDVGQFLHEATRCVRPGGKLVMIEPWPTPWSKLIYTRLHSEPFKLDSNWEIPNTGPLSGANMALPWIVFQRDRVLFEAQYPQWRIKTIELMMPFCYLFSGGVSLRSFLPGWMYRPIRALERRLNQKNWAMFALIELERMA